MTAPTSAAAVANAFLDIQDSDKSQFPRIDQMKIQKLVFYAHAWWLAIEGKPLFDEDVCAWPWGPVVPAIYNQTRRFGRDAIVGWRATEMVKTGAGSFDFSLREPPPPDEAILQFLREVWDAHKHMSGVQLSNATHAAGEPWTIMLAQYGDLGSKPTIPNDLIKDTFRAKMQKAPE